MNSSATRSVSTPRTLGLLLFPGFELLDVFGPAEMFGRLLDKITSVSVAAQRGRIASAQGIGACADVDFEDCPALDLLLVPGGMGTRVEVDNTKLIEFLVRRDSQTEITMSVCTGAALLARAGLLDGRRATTNKRAFAWVKAQGPHVEWVPEARWVEDGKYVSSAGVSAGMDMALAVITSLFGEEVAQQAALETEYDWHRDSGWDPFAKLNQLV